MESTRQHWFKNISIAKKLYLEALDSLNASNDHRKNLDYLFSRLGDVFYLEGNYQDAIKWYNKYFGTYSHVQNTGRISKFEIYSKRLV